MAGKNFWQGRQVLVTGADGFIGSWVAKGLLEQGAQVRTIVRQPGLACSMDALGIREKLDVKPGDITDYKAVETAFNGVDSCFHLAAQAFVEQANRNPLPTFESNIKGTWNILEAARKGASVERVIVASSDKAYGVQKKLPYTEDSPLLGRFPYDASKACADVLAQGYATSYGLPVSITRNANTFGGADLNLSRIVPGVIKWVLHNEVTVIRSDGKPKRDYVYVKDIANAYLLLGENLHRREVRGNAFNFGSGKPVSVLELFTRIIRLCGKKVKPHILNEARNEIPAQWLSNRKAKKVLGWKPRYSLDQGLRETIDWYKAYYRL